MYNTLLINELGASIALSHDFIDDPIVEVVGNRIVVGYLSYDDAENPMEHDGMGKLYFDSEALYHLGISEFGGRSRDAVPDLDIDGIVDELALVISDRIREDIRLIPWGVKLRVSLGQRAMEALAQMVYDGDDQGIDWTQEDLDNIKKLGTREELLTQAWNRMYERGEAGTYLAVPVRVDDHGVRGVRAYTCYLDDANAAWVPGKEEIANMRLSNDMAYREKLSIATEYADRVLKDYEMWRNGEVYGIVTEVFDADTLEKVEDDAVWGCYGRKYAERELKESIRCILARYK